MLDAKELIEKVDNELVKEILEEHGSPCYGRTTDGRTGQEILWFKTICHEGQKPKLMYYCDTHDFYCLTQCGRMTFWTFIMQIRHCEFYDAVKYIAKKLGIVDRGKGDESASERENNAHHREMSSFITRINKDREERKSKLTELPEYNKHWLDLFEKDVYYKGWLDEGISAATMQKYNIRWFDAENHIIIPHYDINNRLVGIRRRSLNPEDAKNKYMPELINGTLCQHPLTMNLYGLEHNKEAIKQRREIVIVEAEKSVLLSDTFYGDESVAVATCGFNLSGAQIDMLKQLNCQDVYLGFDKDFDVSKPWLYKDRVEKIEYEHFINRLEMIGKRLNTFQVHYLFDFDNLLQKKDSPFDRGQEIYEKIKLNSMRFIDNGKSLQQHINISLDNNKYRK